MQQTLFQRLLVCTIFSTVGILCHAQNLPGDTLYTDNYVLDSLLANADTLEIGPDSIGELTVDDNILCFFDEAMAWLDTTDCSATDIVEDLPDSV